MFVIMSVTMTTAALMLVVMRMTVATTATLMVVIILAMHMTVGNFFGCRRTHIAYRDLEVQVYTSQRVVGINLDELFAHFNYGHRTVAIIGIGDESIAFGHFHAVKQLARYALHQLVVVFAIGFGGIHIQFEAVTDGAVIQRLFQARNQETGPMQVNQRLMAFGAVQHVAGLVRNGIVEGNNAQMAYFHVRFPVLAPRYHQGVKIVLLSIPENPRGEHSPPPPKMAEKSRLCALRRFFCV